MEGKYYKQELLKSDFDFESKNKVLESKNKYHRSKASKLDGPTVSYKLDIVLTEKKTQR